MKLTAIIMAGGKGTRLWPLSREKFPKQFLEIIPGKGSLLQQSVNRISPLVNIKDVFVVASKMYKDIVIKQLPKLPKNNILCEPEAKNTSPAIEFASLVIKEKYGDNAISFVLPSDHVILKQKEFINSLKRAAKLADNGSLVTLGIKPTEPNTGYGYIKTIKNGENVEKFVEKPDLETAKKYFMSINYYWNSGMFIWKISSIENAFKKYMPKQHRAFLNLFKLKGAKRDGALLKTYKSLEPISIDYAVMEKANNVKVVKSDFGWDDVGSWLSLERINKINNDKNYLDGNVITLDTKSSIIKSDKKLITALGLKDIVIIDSKDAILIASKNSINDIKNIYKKINKKYL